MMPSLFWPFRLHRPERYVSCLVLATILAGCADTPRRLQVEEKELGTDGSITRLFHSALYYAFELAPRFDGYLIGIEKVLRPDEGVLVKNRPKEYGLTESALQAKFNDGKVMAITHVIRHSANSLQRANCTLFNAYVQSPESVAKQLIAPCDTSVPADIRAPKEAFSNSWTALANTGKDMQGRIGSRPAKAEGLPTSSSRESNIDDRGPYTHVVVVVMGWNTVQEEAVRNINSLVWNLQRAHDEHVGSRGRQNPPVAVPPFNPLVVGVTWPSQWNSDWIDPVIKLVSFPTKAGDADEVGMSWLGVLLHETISKAQPGDPNRRVPVVVLGHSFGAKASSVATCAGPAVVRSADAQILPLAKVDLLVNFEPAYLAERVFGRTSWLQNVVYPNGCPSAKRFVITASSTDTAVPLPFWGDYLGEQKSYKKFCASGSNPERQVNCAVARASGSVEATRQVESTIYYVDASELISENAYGTGGGSHSDIYRLEHGRLVYSAIIGREVWSKPVQ